MWRWGYSRLVATITALFFLGLFLNLYTPQAGAAGPNLAPNPSFETDPSSAYRFSFYPTSARPIPVSSWASDAYHTGTRSLKSVNATNFNGNFSRWTFNTGQGVVAGHQYTASVWLKTQSVSNQAKLNMRFFKSWSIAISGVSSTGVSGTSDWTQVSVTGTAPTTTTLIYLEFMLYGTGTVWADDVYLADLSVGPVAPADTTPPSI